MISFLLNNRATTIEPTKADLTLLEYIREQQKLTGSKEGCASGDCGACTVVLAEIDPTNDAQLKYKAINSCVTFMSALQGKQLITVEHLVDGKTLHPVQQSLVDHHGSQCGFCTPGFIMSMFALYQQNTPVDRDSVIHALSGNLCRCTGYRPIIDATLAACENKSPDKFATNQAQTIAELQKLNNQAAGTGNLLMPSSRKALAEAKAKHPKAKVFAGSTDLALEVTQQLKNYPQLISLSKVPELNQLTSDEYGLTIGAALPFADIQQALLTHFADLSELILRFAATPIRNQASLGGNVANASPIGDMPPALLALNAEFHLHNGSEKRVVSAKDFFLDYRVTALQTDEWLEAIYIPYLTKTSHLRAYKVSKRYEDDISAVCAVFNIQLENQHITQLDTGFGGVAAIPAHLPALSDALIGKNWSSAQTYEAGKQIISKAFSPIDDVRASKSYRLTMLENLWKRFWLETNQQNQQIATRVVQLPSSDEGRAHA